MYQTTHYTYRLLLICCLLAQLANCKQCGRNNSEEPSSSAIGTSDTNSSGGAPLPPSPITDAMVQEAIDKKNATPGQGWELLEEALKDLKNGINNTIDKRGNNNWTALHYAAWLGKPDIVKALLERNADVNLQESDSYAPFHIALVGSPNVALLLLNSNKISKANLKAAVIGGKVTALAYTVKEEAKGGANQADWQAIIKALKAAGAKK
jgi:hypothetical protein